MPIVQNPSIGAAAAALLVATTPITSAQIKAIDITPIQLIPAPGAGKIIVVLGLAYVYDFGTHAYECASDFLVAEYPTTDGVAGNIQNLLTQAQSAFVYISGSSGFNGFPSLILPGDDNQELDLIGLSTYNVGPIVTATLGAGGLGYAANDTGTITTGNGDATYKVLTVGAGGAVLTFQITAPGTGYATGAGQATATGGAQPGVGVGFTVNITAVQTGDGTLKVTTYYQILAVP